MDLTTVIQYSLIAFALTWCVLIVSEVIRGLSAKNTCSRCDRRLPPWNTKRRILKYRGFSMCKECEASLMRKAEKYKELGNNHGA